MSTLTGAPAASGGVTSQTSFERTVTQPAAGALVFDTDLSMLYVGDGATWGGTLAGKAQAMATVDRGVALPAIGETLYDTDLKTLWVGDGATMGGVAVGGAAGAPATAAWDWTEGVALPVLADWQDAKTLDATVPNSPSIYDAVLGGKALRIVPGAVPFRGGIARAVAGDFVWAFRLGFIPAHFGQLDNGTGSSLKAFASYTDAGGAGTTLMKPTYGGGVWMESGYYWQNHYMGSYSLPSGYGTAEGSVVAIDHFTWARSSTVDLWLEYVSATSTLTVWGAPKGEVPIKMGEQVIAGAVHSGYVGVNVIQSASADLDNRVLLLRAASVGTVPGFE